jgi:hypothetical protein
MGLPRDVPSAGFSWEAAGLRNDGGRGRRRYGHPPAGGRLRLYLPVLRRGSRRSTPPTRPRSSQTPQAYVGRSPRADDSAGSSWPTRREDARRRLGRSFPIGLIPLGPRRRSGGPSPEAHGALPSKGGSLTVFHADRAGFSRSARRSGEHRLQPGSRPQTAQSEAASSVGGVFKVALNSSYGCRGG